MSDRRADEQMAVTGRGHANGARLLAWQGPRRRDRTLRNVACFYSIAVWVTAQLADTMLPALDYGSALVKGLVICAVAGLPVALILAWSFRWASGGLEANRGQRRRGQPVAATETCINLTLILASLLLVSLLLVMAWGQPGQVVVTPAVAPATTAVYSEDWP